MILLIDLKFGVDDGPTSKSILLIMFIVDVNGCFVIGIGSFTNDIVGLFVCDPNRWTSGRGETSVVFNGHFQIKWGIPDSDKDDAADGSAFLHFKHIKKLYIGKN